MTNASKSIERNPSVNSTLVGPDGDPTDDVQISTKDRVSIEQLKMIHQSLELIVAILNKGYETDLKMENMNDDT